MGKWVVRLRSSLLACLGEWVGRWVVSSMQVGVSVHDDGGLEAERLGLESVSSFSSSGIALAEGLSVA